MNEPVARGSSLEGTETAVSWRSWAMILSLGIACSALGAVWARYAMLIHRTSHVAESVPPLSALAGLLLLLVLRHFWCSRGQTSRLTQSDILAAYAFICMAVTIGFIGLYRQVFRLLTTYVYGEQEDATIRAIRAHLPSWLVPTDTEVIRQMWEGLKGAALPWRAWALPMAAIGGIFVLFYFTCACLIGLFHRRWSRDERLAYPVAALALELVGTNSEGGFRRLLRSQWFWGGTILALIFNLAYIIPAIVGWNIPPVQYDFNALFPLPPWNAGAPGPYFRLNLMVFGLGFLVPMDVLLTIWVMVVVVKLEAVIAAYLGVPSGYGGPLFLIARQEGLGAYAALVIIMAWAARVHLWNAVKHCAMPLNLAPGAPGRWTLLGFLAGAVALLCMLVKAGMVLWFGAIFLALILIRVIVMARVRAQAGIPNIYLHVFEARSMYWLFGGVTLAAAGQQTIAALVLLSFLVDCTFVTPYIADGFRIAEATGFGHRRWILLSVLAVATGFILATLAQFTAIYEYGFGMLGQKPEVWPANEILAKASAGEPVRVERLVIAGAGFVTTTVFAILQRAFFWFPFSPVGFVVTCAIGDYVCGPVFFAWVLKLLTMKYGGGQGYRAARTLCIGLVFAHLTVAAIWGFLGAFDAPPTRRYQIGFW